MGTAQKRLSRWNSGWNENGKLTTYRTQRSFGKDRSKGKWAGERQGRPTSNQLLFIKSLVLAPTNMGYGELFLLLFFAHLHINFSLVT